VSKKGKRVPTSFLSLEITKKSGDRGGGRRGRVSPLSFLPSRRQGKKDLKGKKDALPPISYPGRVKEGGGRIDLGGIGSGVLFLITEDERRERKKEGRAKRGKRGKTMAAIFSLTDPSRAAVGGERREEGKAKGERKGGENQHT